MEMNYCRRCGTPLTSGSAGSFVCENNHTLYVNASPTAGVFFVDENSNVLLSVRGVEPFKGYLDSFGGFVEEHETAEQAATRELEEELGLTPDQYEPLQFISTEIAPYPFDGETRSLLGTFFWSRLKPGANPIPADDVADIEKVPLAEVDMTKMDNVDVRAAIQKLQHILL